MNRKVKNGMKNFQAKYINLSNRYRGRTARIQMIKIIVIKEYEIWFPKNNNEVKKEKNKILEYSAKNSRVKPPEEYSTL